MRENFIPRNILSIRKAAMITQSEFANLIGVKRTTLAGYESGVNDPSLFFMERITELTGIGLKALRTTDISPELNKMRTMKKIIKHCKSIK